MDENIYLSMPSRYVPNMTETWQIEAIQKLKIIIAIGQEDTFLNDNLQLNQALYNKQIDHEFIIWEGEAHKPEQWKTMVQLYF
jgi:esterase/lipase superfamily enzyme